MRAVRPKPSAERPVIVLIENKTVITALHAALEAAISATVHVSTGVAMLLVEQNLEIAAALADTCIVLAAGRVVWRGSTRDATSNEEIRQAYFA